MADVYVDYLAGSRLFADVPRAELAELAMRARVRRYAKGQIIFGQDDPGAHLFIVASGQVAVGSSSSEGQFLEYHSYGPGDMFGEFAVLDEELRSADAVAQEASELLLVPRDDFLRVVRAHPDILLLLIRQLIDKIRKTNELLVEITFNSVPTRLAQALLDLAESTSGAVGDGKERTFLVTQERLANLVGARRETVNRWLSHFENKGLIRAQRGQVTIVSSHGLRQWIV